MKNIPWICLAGALVVSCTAYVDQPRPSLNKNGKGVQIMSHFPLATAGRLTSLAVDRMGNAYFTESGGWNLSSVGNDGVEIYRQSLSHLRDVLLSGTIDGFWLLNDLEKKLKHYDRQGEKTLEIAYSGALAATAAITPSGDLFLLDDMMGQIKVLDKNGQELRVIKLEPPIAGAFKPNSIAVNQSGNIIAMADSRNGMVSAFNLYGVKHSVIKIAVSSHSQSLAFDYLGRLWVCQPGLGTVEAFSYDGRQWNREQEIKAQSPYAVAMGPFGIGAIADQGNLMFIKF